MGEKYIGFCWTRRIPKVGFDPKTDQEAEYRSKLIRYQKHVLSLHAHKFQGSIKEWVIYVDKRPDGSSRAIVNKLNEAKKKAKPGGIILFVDFRHLDDHYVKWRSSKFLTEFLESEPNVEPVDMLSTVDLPPFKDKPGERSFSPIEHFKWHICKENERKLADEANHRRLVELSIEFGNDFGKIAKTMNSEGRKTVQGDQWRKSNVEKKLARNRQRATTNIDVSDEGQACSKLL